VIVRLPRSKLGEEGIAKGKIKDQCRQEEKREAEQGEEIGCLYENEKWKRKRESRLENSAKDKHLYTDNGNNDVEEEVES